MKKLITSAGLFVLGAGSLQAQTVYTPAPGLTQAELAKPWSVSASVRGFYDDNYTTSPRNIRRDSFGFELSPSAAINWTLPQTYLGLSYVYGYRWFEDRQDLPGRDYDQSHQANAKLSHAFTERFRVDLANSFAIAQEPEVLQPAGPITVPIRSEGDNLRNHATATITAELTELVSLVLGYSNTLYDYDNPGFSALLDRMEHLGTANVRLQVLPQTVVLAGYQFGFNDFQSSRPIAPLSPLRGTDRDNYSHYMYVGVDQAISPEFTVSLRGGAQYTDYTELNHDLWNPYVDGSLTYTFAPASYLQAGVRHTRLTTDVTAYSPGTLDQEVSIVYGSLNHRITPRLLATALSQFQYGIFEGGAFDNDKELFLLTGVNFSYAFTQFLSAEVGYNYDRLRSDLGNRSYTRNRVYVGVRATF
jgi:hypothetical protein